MFSYLKSKANSMLIFVPKEPNVGKSDFVECDWSDFYPGMEEALPLNPQSLIGKCVMQQMFIDSNHAGDKVSQHSRTGFVIFLNYSIIDWLLKKQSTVETSVFGAKLPRMHGICYKFHMMGVPIWVPHMCTVITCLLSPIQASLSQHSRRSQT